MQNRQEQKEKSRSNGNQKSGNTHKARQMTEAGTPEDTDDKSNDHKVGRTIVTCHDGYKVYRTTGEDGEDQEPTDEVYRTYSRSKSLQYPTRDAPPAYYPQSLRGT